MKAKLGGRTLTINSNDVCDDCRRTLYRNEILNIIQDRGDEQKIRKVQITNQQVRTFMKRMFEPTWMERLEDWYLKHIQYHWVVWFGGYHDDCNNFEQRLAIKLGRYIEIGCGQEHCQINLDNSYRHSLIYKHKGE